MRRLFGERRQSPRRRAERKARLVFNLTVTSGDAPSRTMPLQGYTRDISESGLAIIVPSLRLGSLYLTAAAAKLRIVILDLPTGEVEIEASPVR